MPVPKIKKIERKKLLPDFWKRISRAEKERQPLRAEIDESKRERYAEHDKVGAENKRRVGWPAFKTDLWRAEENLQANISDYMQKRVPEFSEQKPMKVMELGCGAGTALEQIKARKSKKIKTTGVVLERTQGEKYSGVDKLIVGDINKINPREKYDLIFSSVGSTFYTNLKTTALERVISWLRPNGRAIVEMGMMSESRLNELKTLLSQNGIKKYDLRRDKIVGSIILDFVKPATKLPK